MSDGQKLPEEFPKKLEDKICPNWRTCQITECIGKQPHIKNHECGLGHQPMHYYRKLPCKDSKPCIQIPDIRLDKGGE